LTLVIPTLAFGGAERVLARLANHWAEVGYAVTLITLSSAESDTYPLDARVCRIGLGVMGASRNALQAVWNNFHRVRVLRRAIRESQPDVVVSFTDQMNVTTLLATRFLRVAVIVAERIDPRQQPIGRLRSFLRRRLYPRATAVIVQTEAVREWICRFVPRRKVHVIPNAVESPAADSVAGGRSPIDGSRRIVAVGRLVPQKGFDLLIDAFAQIAARQPQWTLHILGNGPARDSLVQQADARGLSERVQLHEWTPAPTAFFQEGELFVLPSRYEGFPNALLEAMACGLPAVSFDCDSGPAEIIRDGIDGLLVPKNDPAALAVALERLISDESERRRLGSRAREVVQRFSVPLFFHRWDEVVANARWGEHG
jgi:glycosyltransferase involved in cell wall biosynthesis